MARYYLIADYLVPDFRKSVWIAGVPDSDEVEERQDPNQALDLQPPKNYTVLSLSPELQLRVVFYSGDIGHFLIKAPNRREAYALGNAVQAYFSLEYGVLRTDNRSTYFLSELNRVPQSSWTQEDLLKALKDYQPSIPGINGIEFKGGVTVSYDFESLSRWVAAIYNDPSLNEAFAHVNQSLALFYGWMPGSYYISNYVRERKELSRWDLEKRYFESRPRYEVAFLAVFKAIERFIRVNDIKKHQLKRSLSKLPYPEVDFSSRYTRFHEVFSGLPKRTTVGEIIGHFLDIRNTVAAHANQNPPAKFIVSEDSLFEVQLLVKYLIFQALEYYQVFSEEGHA